MSWPPRRTSSCAVEDFSASLIIWRPTEFGTFCAFVSSCAFANATVPDFEMPPGVAYGSETLTTCGTRANSARNAFDLLFDRGVVHRGRAAHHDLHRVARLRLEVRGEQIRRARRFGVRRAEVGREVRPRDRRQHVDADQRGQPEQHDATATPVTKASERAERHERRNLRGDGAAARTNARMVRSPDYSRIVETAEIQADELVILVVRAAKAHGGAAPVGTPRRRDIADDGRARPRRPLPRRPRRRHRGRARALSPDHQAIDVGGRRAPRTVGHRPARAAPARRSGTRAAPHRCRRRQARRRPRAVAAHRGRVGGARGPRQPEHRAQRARGLSRRRCAV